MNNPLVSVIISTKNEEKNIKNLLESIRAQTYKHIETIVVDNNSIDKTRKISRQYTDKVFNQGPERSGQRNFGIEKAKGKFVLILDADMILDKKVIEECVRLSFHNNQVAIIIPEISIGKGFWAQCKVLEKSFYLGVDYIEAARFYQKALLKGSGGYDTELISREDYDLSQRVAAKYQLGRVKSYIYHNEGQLTLLETIKKHFYYGQSLARYWEKTREQKKVKKQTNVRLRVALFFAKPAKLFKNPLIGFGLLFMKFCEFSAEIIGCLASKYVSK